MSECTHVSICMCTKFQVDTFENDVFRVFQRPKMATFRDIPMSMQYALPFLFFYTYLHAPNVVIRSFFELRMIKRLENMYHEAK